MRAGTLVTIRPNTTYYYQLTKWKGGVGVITEFSSKGWSYVKSGRVHLAYPEEDLIVYSFKYYVNLL